MENKQMTAVEWLEKQLYEWAGGRFYFPPHFFEESKEMEKKQEKQLIVGTYIDLKMNKKLEYGMEYLRVLDDVEKKAEKYYNEIIKIKI
jgi:hypothetical protein